MIVAFVGNDGSGKSSAVKAVARLLEARGQRVKVVAGYDHLLLGHVRRWVSRALGRRSFDVSGDYHRGAGEGARPGRTVAFYHLWPFLVWLDYLLLVAWHAATGVGRVTIFDRYAYDYACSLAELGYGGAFARKLFESFPRPAHVYVFDVSPEMAYQRKRHDHDMAPDFYGRQRTRYLELARRKGLMVLNTDRRTVDEIAAVIVEAITGKP